MECICGFKPILWVIRCIPVVLQAIGPLHAISKNESELSVLFASVLCIINLVRERRWEHREKLLKLAMKRGYFDWEVNHLRYAWTMRRERIEYAGLDESAPSTISRMQTTAIHKLVQAYMIMLSAVNFPMKVFANRYTFSFPTSDGFQQKNVWRENAPGLSLATEFPAISKWPSYLIFMTQREPGTIAILLMVPMSQFWGCTGFDWHSDDLRRVRVDWPGKMAAELFGGLL